MRGDFKNEQGRIEAVMDTVFRDRHAEIMAHIQNDGYEVTLKYVYPAIKLSLSRSNIYINLTDEQLFTDLLAVKFNKVFNK